MMPSPPAFDTAATSGAIDTPPMPARQIGTSMPKRSQTGVRSGEGVVVVDPESACMEWDCRRRPRRSQGRPRHAMPPPPVPVVVGVGQITDRPDDPRDGLEPLALMEAAARRALDDAGVARVAWPTVDTLAVVTNVFHDYGDTATMLAARLGCSRGAHSSAHGAATRRSRW